MLSRKGGSGMGGSVGGALRSGPLHFVLFLFVYGIGWTVGSVMWKLITSMFLDDVTRSDSFRLLAVGVLALVNVVFYVRYGPEPIIPHESSYDGYGEDGGDAGSPITVTGGGFELHSFDSPPPNHASRRGSGGYGYGYGGRSSTSR